MPSGNRTRPMESRTTPRQKPIPDMPVSCRVSTVVPRDLLLAAEEGVPFFAEAFDMMLVPL